MAGSLLFLAGKHARILSVILVLQAVGLYAVSRREPTPAVRPLAELPAQFGSWRLAQEGVVEKEVADVLRADDLLNRAYFDTSGNRGANLFIAFFKSQRTGQAPHSPKNCLPGAGWVPSESAIVPVRVPGGKEPIRVNRYVVSKGNSQSVVVYWYQSHNRVIASEYLAKIYLVADAIRYNRTDTALVRVVVPVVNKNTAVATATAEDFVRAFFSSLRQLLPS